ncbi:MAG: hypothetical protein IMZ71_02720, partial [Chloroflexi bacterium]|nr:hypothetical protein [Chloroflexota bacterium]
MTAPAPQGALGGITPRKVKVKSFEELAGPEPQPGITVSAPEVGPPLTGEAYARPYFDQQQFMGAPQNVRGLPGQPATITPTTTTRPPYGFAPGQELDKEGFSDKDLMNQSDVALKSQSLIQRFGKKIANSFSEIGQTIISSPLSPLGIPEKETRPYMKQAMDELAASGFKGSAAQAQQMAQTRASQLAAAKKVPSFEIAPAEGFGEKATDVGAGLTSFLAQLAITRKILPAGTPEPIIWEVQSQLGGGIPLQGMVTRQALGGIGKIPTSTAAGKIGKVAAESGLFAGVTGVMGGSNEDMIVAALVPVGLNAWGFAKQKQYITNLERSLRQKALHNYNKRISEGGEPSWSKASLEAELRTVETAVAKAKQKIYSDDAFAPAKEKWETERQKALKLISKGGKENMARGNAILDFVGKTQPSEQIQMPTTRIGEAIETAKEVGKAVLHPVKTVQKAGIPEKPPLYVPPVSTEIPSQAPVMPEVTTKIPPISTPVEARTTPAAVQTPAKEVAVEPVKQQGQQTGRAQTEGGATVDDVQYRNDLIKKYGQEKWDEVFFELAEQGENDRFNELDLKIQEIDEAGKFDSLEAKKLRLEYEQIVGTELEKRYGFMAKLQEDLAAVKEMESAPPLGFYWKTSKVGDVIPGGDTVLARRIKTKTEAQKIAKEQGGRVALDGPRTWAVLKIAPTEPITPVAKGEVAGEETDKVTAISALESLRTPNAAEIEVARAMDRGKDPVQA